MGDLSALRRSLSELDRVVVAFSGGADSSLLAWVATETLGPERALSVTALSPSLARQEEVECRLLAAEWGLRWTGIPTHEMEDAAYVTNGDDRCTHCKGALMDVLVPLAGSSGSVVVLGVNVDDLGDHRPGQLVAKGRGARFPLVEAGFTKSDVRACSRDLGLRTWDKPAAACLASRIPYGTPVTVGRLRSIDRAESVLRDLGVRQVRVRHHGTTARIEVPEEDLGRLLELRGPIVERLRAIGFLHVAMDLEGYRSGSLNRSLARSAGVAPS